MSSIICVGDIHIKQDNTHLIDIVEKHLVHYIEKYNPMYVILLGDILHYHEKLHTQNLNKACKLIENISKYCKVICLVGNHDYIQNAQFCTTNHWMNPLKKWKDVFIVDQPQKFYLTEEKDFFVCSPYVPPGRFIEALNTHVDDEWKNSKFLFAHQEFRGCKMGAIVSEHGDEWSLENPLVISGHIHDKQKLPNNIYYTGACLQHSFGETGYPTLLLIQGTELIDLKLDIPRKKTMYVTLEELKQTCLEEDITRKTKSDDIESLRIVVKGDHEKYKIFQQSKEYETLQKNLKVKIAFKPEEIDEVKEENNNIPFEDLLHENVLRLRNEKLYSIYQKIVYDTTVDENDIIIV